MPFNISDTDMDRNAQVQNESDRLNRDRVRRMTFKRDLERIDEKTHDSIRYYSDLGPKAIARRLAELDKEWAVDRALMTGAGFFVWLGLILGTTVRRRLYLISAAAATITLVFALFGWAPPVLFLRRMGFRTRGEIDLERIALKALRGDFDQFSQEGSDRETRIDQAMKAAS
jgi:hypothetical protein